MSVLVVGSVALDSVETPFDKRTDVLGGSASFFSVVASIISDVRLVAVVGQDFPEEHVRLFEEHDVDLAGLQRAEGETFRWSGRYLPDMVGRETLDTQLNVFETFRPTLPEAYRQSPYVLLANIHPALQLQVLEQIQRPKLVALDTMNLWIETEREALDKVLARAGVLMINDEELALLSGEPNLVIGAEKVRQMGPRMLVVKRGDAGALLFDDKGVFVTPAFPLGRVTDPTGAGDTFAGGFLSYVAHKDDLSGETLRQAMVYGSVVASFCVEDFSLNRLATLGKSEIQQRCGRFADLVRFNPITLD